MTKTWFSGLLVLFCVAACSNVDQEQPGYSFKIFEENGITVAETTGGPKYKGELFEYIPAFTIESGDTEESMLFDPWRITGDSKGWFYVYDGGSEDIVVFDPDGKFHSRFGRKGVGPGEFQQVRFLCTDNDYLYIYDFSLMRTTRFRRSGEMVDLITNRHIPWPFTDLRALVPLEDGEQLCLYSSSDIPPGNYNGPGNSWCSVVRLSAQGDTVWSWNSDPIQNLYPSPPPRGVGGYYSMLYPHSLRPEVFYVPDLGVVAMAFNAPQLDIFDLNGLLRKRIRIEMGDQTVTEEDRQTVNDICNQIINNPQESPDYRIAMEAYRKGMQFGETKVPWNDLGFTDRNYLFLTCLNIHWSSIVVNEEDSYMVISPDGEYLGITTPPVGSSLDIANGKLLVNHTDWESGEFTLTVYEIRSIVNGLEYPN